MVAIEHRQKSSSTNTATTTTAVLSPTSSTTSASSSSATTTTTSSIQHTQHQLQQKHELQQKETTKQQQQQQQQHQHIQNKRSILGKMSLQKSEKTAAVTGAELIKHNQQQQQKPQEAAGNTNKCSAVSQRSVDIKIAKKPNMDVATKELTKKVLKLDLTGKELEELALKSPKSPITARLPHQTSLTSSVDVEDRKTLREALYQGIFHRHRRTIFAVGSFLRMLRSRNSQYNTIRSSSEGEDIDEVR